MADTAWPHIEGRHTLPCAHIATRHLDAIAVTRIRHITLLRTTEMAIIAATPPHYAATPRGGILSPTYAGDTPQQVDTSS